MAAKAASVRISFMALRFFRLKSGYNIRQLSLSIRCLERRLEDFGLHDRLDNGFETRNSPQEPQGRFGPEFMSSPPRSNLH